MRWWIVLLAGLSWPFAYAVKLGQVGPILFLLFAIGWRWLDDPIRLGRERGARHGDQAPAGDHLRLGAPDPALGGGRGRVRSSWRFSPSPRPCWPGVERLVRLPDACPDRSATRSRPSTTSRPARSPTSWACRPSSRSLLQLACTVAGRRGRRRGRPVGHRRGLLPRRGHREPAALADPVGPLRDAPAPAGRLPAAPPAAGGRCSIPLGDRGAARSGSRRRSSTRSSFAVALVATLGVGVARTPGRRPRGSA